MENLPKHIIRLNKIKDMLKDKGNVDILDLSRYFNVSKMTIYSDLKKLQNDNGILIVKKGAAYRGNKELIDFDLSHYERLNSNKKKKKAIAKIAIKYIKSNEAIFLDGSTTIKYLADLLAKENSLKITVLTISPIIALELSKNKNIEVICTGGKLNNIHYSYFNGIEQYAKSININKAFISCVGFSIENGFTEQVYEEAQLKSTLKNYCKNIYILADSSKLNRVGAYTFGPTILAKKIITDISLDKKYQQFQ